MNVFDNLELVVGGDRWCDTPEGKATVDGGAPRGGGSWSEVCRTVSGPFEFDGQSLQICYVVREKGVAPAAK